MNVYLGLLLMSTRFMVGEKFTSCIKAGHFAFTFDQAPSPNTGLILNTFEKYKVKATFHITVNYLENPVILAYLRKAVLDGHLIGIFVPNEPEKDGITEDKRIELYLKRTSALIQKYINHTPRFLRFAHPGPGKAVVKKLESAGYIVTAFNLDSQDYEYAADSSDKSSIFQHFKKTLDQILPPSKGAFISVQRDEVEASARQCEQIVAYVLKQGYKIVRLDECVGRVTTRNDDDTGFYSGEEMEEGVLGGEDIDTDTDLSDKTKKDKGGFQADKLIYLSFFLIICGIFLF
eukprot:GHVP01006195.1.p1 GENE.GHVP01006195.1~~GHVP01006195.1.p1  ORF type:complete len:290 (-),score=44.65 GHVP01006195.1:32-901(-)